MGKRRRKRTPEERAAQEAYSRELDRRLLDMIERYRQINAEKRTAGGQTSP